MMTTKTAEIIDLLHDDMVSHGLLVQQIFGKSPGPEILREHLSNSLIDLLATGEVEVGTARMTRPDYVEFEGWKGSTSQKVARAVEAVANAEDHDKEFAYWLCLRGNVDRYEGDPT